METHPYSSDLAIQKRLREAKDATGWRPPWHYHYRIIRNGVDREWDPDFAPIYSENCSAALCEAPGCPRTTSGFPKSDKE